MHSPLTSNARCPRGNARGLFRGRQHRSPGAAALAYACFWLSFQTRTLGADGFSTSTTASDRARPPRPSPVPLNYANAPCHEQPTLHEFALTDHKPLGCAVEESLADEADGTRHVFVAEVTEGGHAHRAGLRAGDVIVQLSGTFDEVVEVAGLGLERIRSLVSGRPPSSPLVVRVARGSDVMARHALALVELCTVDDDPKTAECITYIHSAADDVGLYEDAPAACEEDDGTECMLESMWNGWYEGAVPSDGEPEEEVPVVQKKKVAPWSSRSSPSGTYVRDPKTRKLVNIDE